MNIEAITIDEFEHLTIPHHEVALNHYSLLIYDAAHKLPDPAEALEPFDAAATQLGLLITLHKVHQVRYDEMVEEEIRREVAAETTAETTADNPLFTTHAL